MAVRPVCAGGEWFARCVFSGFLAAGAFCARGEAGGGALDQEAGQIKVVAPVGASGDGYGHAAASDGARIAVGAPRLGAPAGLPGYVDVLLRGPEGPAHEGRLFGTPGVGDHFGFAVAIAGDTLAVGVPYDVASTSPCGEVRVFTRGAAGWIATQTVSPPDGANGDFFGGSVALDGSCLVVGAPFHRAGGYTGAGAVYVFERAEPGGPFAFVAKLVAFTPQHMGRFGWAVASRGSTLAVGAPRSESAGALSGAVYVFERGASGTWSAGDLLLGLDTVAGDRFGTALALGEGALAVGAPHASAGRGKAYVFERAPGGPWSQVALLYVAATGNDDRHGASIGVAGGVIAVGAPESDEDGQIDAGSVAIFQRIAGAWLPVDRRTALDASAGDNYGSALVLTGSELLVGAPQASGPIDHSGAVYLHHVPLAEIGRTVCAGSNLSCPCGNGAGEREGCRNGTGAGGSLTGSGSTSVGHGDLELRAHGLPPASMVLLFVGVEAAAAGRGIAFGDGLRCAAGAPVRLGVAQANGAGAVDLSPLLPGQGAWAAGDSRTFQAWYTDPVSPCGWGYNLTAGLELVFEF